VVVKASVEAVRKLQSTQAEARRLGFLGLELETQLAIGQIEMGYGAADAGRSRLGVLEKIARAKGYALIARKAAAAAGT
jgi:hypothetical protein